MPKNEASTEEILKRLFLREKPVLALLAIEELNPAYASLIAKRIDSTFPHTSSILSQLEKLGLVKSRPEGRIRYLELTDDGKKVAQALQELSNLFKEPDKSWKKLEKLRQLVTSEAQEDAALRLGPLRRDLMKLKMIGDKDLLSAADDLDCMIAAAIRK